MKTLIDCRHISLSEFAIRKGYQPQNALFYITSGEIEFLMAGERQRASEGDLVSFPRDVYFEREMLRPTEFYYVRYETADTKALPVGIIRVNNTGRLLSTLQYLLQLNELPHTAHLKDAFLADVFHQLEVERLMSVNAEDSVTVAVRYFYEKNLHRKITLAEVAEVACLSPSGLNRHFKKSVGVTPMEYLTAQRLKKAEALLCHTAMPIARIAALCGFESPYYFSNTFKKHRGESPAAYRHKYET